MSDIALWDSVYFCLESPFVFSASAVKEDWHGLLLPPGDSSQRRGVSKGLPPP